MKIIICKPGKLPEQRVIREGLNLRMMQQIVEGHIEVVHADGLPKGVVIVCNADGKLQNLPQNMWVRRGGWEDLLFGTFFLCGVDVVDKETGEEDLVPLTDAQASKIAAKLSGGVIPTTDPKLTDRRCCLCGKYLMEDEGNNAAPLCEGECCDSCNYGLVVPERMKMQQCDAPRMKRRTWSVTDQIGVIAGRICDELCKYSDQLDKDEDYDTICGNCPLNLLM